MPQIIGQPLIKDVTVGSSAVLPCNATGYPVPTIEWSKVIIRLTLLSNHMIRIRF